MKNFVFSEGWGAPKKEPEKRTSASTSIGEWAYHECAGLVSMEIPDGTKEICGWAFCDCVNLRSVSLPSSLFWIGDGAFSGCTVLADLVIPPSVRHVGQSAFADCAALSEIVLPSGVTEIAEMTFWGCETLLSVVIPTSVNKIDCDVVRRWFSLREITYAGTKAEWNAIEKDALWDEESAVRFVRCVDGVVEV